MNVIWSPLRAALRALEPKEEKLVQQEAKFKRQLFLRNVTRLKAVVVYFLEWGRFVQYGFSFLNFFCIFINYFLKFFRSCFEWESPLRSLVACILWICGCIWFDISTIPFILLLWIMKLVFLTFMNLLNLFVYLLQKLVCSLVNWNISSIIW